MTGTTNNRAYFPELQTDRLVLRSLTMEDAVFILQHFRDPSVTQYLMDEPPVSVRNLVMYLASS